MTGVRCRLQLAGNVMFGLESGINPGRHTDTVCGLRLGASNTTGSIEAGPPFWVSLQKIWRQRAGGQNTWASRAAWRRPTSAQGKFRNGWGGRCAACEN